MSQIRFNRKLLVIVTLAIFFGIALFFRICLPYDQVFGSNWIKFTAPDAYYHMRLVDNLLHHFPHFITFDPYTFYPHGSEVVWPPLFDWLVASTILIISLGSPTQHIVNVVGAYFPAFLGALVVIAVYFLGKELFGNRAGLFSAGLIAVLPGEFLGRSIIGGTDHHVAEVLFSTLTILFMVLAIKSASQKQLTLGHLKRRDWATITRPLVYCLVTGTLLGVYLLSWVGGLFIVFIISIYFVLQFIIHHFRGEDTSYLGIVGTLSLLISLGISLPVMPKTWFGQLYPQSLIIATLIPAGLSVISKLMISKKIERVYYPLTLAGLGLAGLAIYYIVAPSIPSLIVSMFNIFTPEGASLTITEVQPLLIAKGKLSLVNAWNYFSTGFFLSFISLGILIYASVKKGSAERNLLIIWSVMVLAATLGQRRFAYYLAVNVALLTGYLSWRILQSVILRRPATKRAEKRRKMKSKLKDKEVNRSTARRVIVALGVVAVFFLVFYPNIMNAITTVKLLPFVPTDAWCGSLVWLRENTAEPFVTPDFYYHLYEPPVTGEDYKYPESAYGIMAWWDYGHLITRISHRIPVCNPFQQGASAAALFFTAQDEASASQIMDDLGAKYVIIDNLTATSKLSAIATWTDKNPRDFIDIYYEKQPDIVRPVYILYPEYYHSLATRLYNFDGNEVTPKSTTAISYEVKLGPDGMPYKEITDSKSFSSYEAATEYVSTHKSDSYIIAGTSPFVSPVPLEALKDYKLIYSSDELVEQPDAGTVPAVKIFEYAP